MHNIFEKFSKKEVDRALNIVADNFIKNAYAIREENPYASHVTESEKELYLDNALAYAESIRLGKEYNFTGWQRVNEVLTGECIGFLSR